MKKLRVIIDKRLEELDQHWDSMPVRRQHQVIRYFFAAYALLTAVVIFNICVDTAEAQNSLAVEHIENPATAEKESPAQMQDSLKPILKK